MNRDEADEALTGLRSRWHYQPMTEPQRKAWVRLLTDPVRQWTLPEFGRALDICVDQGGSRQASHEGQRPDVGEFALVLHEARRQLDRNEPKPEPEHEAEVPPEVALERVAEIKRSLMAKREEVP